MPPSQSIIRALPSDVIAKIKSSTSIVHLIGVILELVKNSLDANAHTVFINVDFKRGGCIVEDDGDGIPPTEFEATGGLDTSKFNSSGLYGHRGLFLASLASLSLLTVTSHHIRHECTNSIIFHHSTPVARLIPAPPHQVLRSPAHGTSVVVNDLFGNMPVRVKSRSLALQRPDELEREWGNLRNSLVSLMLANPSLSKLVLLDVETNRRMLIRFGVTSTTETSILPGPREFEFKRIGSILVQSGLITPKNLEFWHEMSASVSGLTIRGAISLQPSPTRRPQFISLGGEPVLSRNGSNVLYNEVNRLFALSDFSSIGTSISERSSVRDAASSVNRLDTRSDASSRSWAKPVNKWPMFYIRIDSKGGLRSDDDGLEELPESEKSIQRIVDVLGVMVREFLRQHNLRPRDDKRQRLLSNQIQSICSNPDSHETGSSRRPFKQGRSMSSTEESFGSRVKIPSFPRPPAYNASQHFTNWSRTKTAKDLNFHSLAHHTRHSGVPPDVIQRKSSLPIVPAHQPNCPITGPEFAVPSGPSTKTLSAQDKNRTEDLSEGSPSDKIITWVDPHTRLAYMINSRTGQTMNSRKSLATQRLRIESDNALPAHPMQTYWLENILETWENPVFSRTEIPIPNLGAEPGGQQTANTSSHDCFKSIGSLNTAQVAQYRGKLRRRALETAEVIAQVDKKFILAKVHTTAVKPNWGDRSNDVLLLIDQHAADERCRIEQLFSEMFTSPEVPGSLKSNRGVRTVEVECLKIEVSLTESGLFQKYRDFFSSWGIGYAINSNFNSTALVTVHTLPLLIAERCRLEPHVLTDLMRREIWSNEEEGRKPLQPNKAIEAEDDEDIEPSDGERAMHQEITRLPASRSWVQQMNGCPRGIVGLLNSRACRTAIMFNDPLNIEECQALLSRLARCAFPFQCAHGRPSMVPILDLRSFPDTVTSLPLDLDVRVSSHDNDSMNLDFMAAFQRQYVS